MLAQAHIENSKAEVATPVLNKVAATLLDAAYGHSSTVKEQ